MRLFFTDGVEIETRCALRATQHNDGWYVVGNGMLAACANEEDAASLLADMKKRRWESVIPMQVKEHLLGYCECCGDVEVIGMFQWDGTNYAIQEDALVACQGCGCSFVVQVGDEPYINGERSEGACSKERIRQSGECSEVPRGE